jgi:hypothetical protein
MRLRIRINTPIKKVEGYETLLYPFSKLSNYIVIKAAFY